METIKLDYPVELNGHQHKSLTMRRPKVKDQLAADSQQGGAAKKETWTFACLCNVSEEVIGELDMLDYQKLQQAYTAFLTNTQGTTLDNTAEALSS